MKKTNYKRIRRTAISGYATDFDDLIPGIPGQVMIEGIVWIIGLFILWTTTGSTGPPAVHTIETPIRFESAVGWTLDKPEK